MYALTKNNEIVGPLINGKINGKLLDEEYVPLDNYKAVAFIAYRAVKDNFTPSEIIRGMAAATGTTIKASIPAELAPLATELAASELRDAAE